MKNILTALFILFSVTAFSQPVITELKFPYHPVRELRYTGPLKILNAGRGYDTKENGLIYKISDEKKVKKENWVVFAVKQYTDKDTLVLMNTFLTQDDRGMSWWSSDTATKTFDKKRTWALKLPLKVGKKWKSPYEKFKATVRCITTDTTIETEVGSLKAFGTLTEFVAQKTKDYQIVSYSYEYYNQEIGKIMMRDVAVLELFKAKRKILVSDGYMKIYYYTGYVKK